MVGVCGRGHDHNTGASQRWSGFVVALATSNPRHLRDRRGLWPPKRPQPRSIFEMVGTCGRRSDHRPGASQRWSALEVVLRPTDSGGRQPRPCSGDRPSGCQCLGVGLAGRHVGLAGRQESGWEHPERFCSAQRRRSRGSVEWAEILTEPGSRPTGENGHGVVLGSQVRRGSSRWDRRGGVLR
jgi:hypothetical protein